MMEGMNDNSATIPFIDEAIESAASIRIFLGLVDTSLTQEDLEVKTAPDSRCDRVPQEVQLRPSD